MDENLQKYIPIVEGLLFVSGDEGITLQQLIDNLSLSEQECIDILKQLEQIYLQDSHGIELSHYNDTYKFLTKSSINEYCAKLFSQLQTNSLSQSALEVLSIIAYKQPITRIEIEEIRGIGCDMMLRKLQARNLIEECGRSDAPGKPYLYQVTDHFLDSFSLVSLQELPPLPKFGIGDDEYDNDLFHQE